MEGFFRLRFVAADMLEGAQWDCGRADCGKKQREKTRQNSRRNICKESLHFLEHRKAKERDKREKERRKSSQKFSQEHLQGEEDLSGKKTGILSTLLNFDCKLPNRKSTFD